MHGFGYSEMMLAILVPAAIAASVSDYRQHRVPNWLNAGLAVSGLVFQSVFLGSEGLVSGCYGLLVGLGFLLPFWLMHAMGAGDVKFMAALGAWMGPVLTLYAVIVGCLLGGVMALGMLMANSGWKQARTNFGILLTKVSSVQTAFSEFGSAQSLSQGTSVMPYAIPLSVGSLVVLVSNYSGWWEVL